MRDDRFPSDGASANDDDAPGDVPHPPLSPAGEARRARILSLALDAARGRRARRRAARAIVVGCTGAAIVASAVVLVARRAGRPGDVAPVVRQVRESTQPSSVQPAPLPPPVARDGPPPGPRRREIVIERIMTDPAIVRQLAVRPAGREWTALDDDAFLARLGKVGRPAGLARVDGGRPVLLFREPGGRGYDSVGRP